jgi:hypothetical protein
MWHSLSAMPNAASTKLNGHAGRPQLRVFAGASADTTRRPQKTNHVSRLASFVRGKPQCTCHFAYCLAIQAIRTRTANNCDERIGFRLYLNIRLPTRDAN